jgi:hypothetical protein
VWPELTRVTESGLSGVVERFPVVRKRLVNSLVRQSGSVA